MGNENLENNSIDNTIDNLLESDLSRDVANMENSGQNIGNQINSVAQQTIPQQQIAQQPAQQPNIYINTGVGLTQEQIKKDKKQKRVNWFFRITTLLVLLSIWVLMLMDYFEIWTLSLSWFEINSVYPFVVILSTLVLWIYKWWFSKILWVLLIVTVLWWITGVTMYQWFSSDSASKFNTSYEIPGNYDKSWNIQHSFYTLEFDNLIWNYNIYWWVSNNILNYEYDGDRTLDLLEEKNKFTLMESKNLNIVQKFKSYFTWYLSNWNNYDIYLKSMIWNHKINLNTTHWQNVKLHNWIWDIELTIWKDIKKDWEMELLTFIWTDLILNIPQGLWIELYHKHLMWKLELENMKKISKNYYQSLNLNEKNNNLKINIRGVYTNLKIKRIN